LKTPKVFFRTLSSRIRLGRTIPQSRSGRLGHVFPEGDKTSSFTVYGYVIAQTIVQVLKQCGDELTRENVMRQAANLKDFELGLLLPGIKINTSSNDYFPVEQMQMSKFNGEYGELFGPVISGEIKKEYAPQRSSWGHTSANSRSESHAAARRNGRKSNQSGY
jgi:hypothetical protein